MSFQPFQIIYQIKDQPIQIEQIRFRQEENLIQTETIDFNDELQHEDQINVDEVAGIYRNRAINAWNKTDNDMDVKTMFETIVAKPPVNIKSEPIEVIPIVDDDYLEAIEFFGNIKQEDELNIVDETDTSEPCFVCNECGQSFKKKVGLGRHLIMHKEFKYHCAECGQTFKRNFYFKKHVCIQCQKCKQYFKANCSLKKHQKLHCGIKSFECDRCGIQLKRKKDVPIHFAEHHLNAAVKFECDLCAMKCMTKEALQVHMNFNHEAVVCQLCSFKTTKHQFHNHLRLVHAKEINLECQLCKKEFKSKRKLYEHERIHSKKFSCHLCQKRFARIELLHIHFENQHVNPKKFPCSFCTKQFPAKKYLVAHLRTHKAYRALTKFTCSICQYSTLYKEHMDRHEKKHERKEKEDDLKKDWIKCDKCPTKLKNKLKLSSHKWKYHKFN